MSGAHDHSDDASPGHISPSRALASAPMNRRGCSCSLYPLYLFFVAEARKRSSIAARRRRGRRCAAATARRRIRSVAGDQSKANDDKRYDDQHPVPYMMHLCLLEEESPSPSVDRKRYGWRYSDASRHDMSCAAGIADADHPFRGSIACLAAYGTAPHCGATQWSSKEEWHDTCHDASPPSPFLGLARRLFRIDNTDS